MKPIILSLMMAIGAIGAASAADLGNSVKDVNITTELTPPLNVTGIYVTGFGGMATGDRSFDRSIHRFSGNAATDEAPRDTTDISRLGELGTDDIEGAVFGGGVSYLMRVPNSRLGIETGFETSIYTDSDTSDSFKGHKPTFHDVETGAEIPNPYGSTSNGSLKFERDFDIDLVAKGHYFVTDRFSLYAGGGLSWARANMQATSGADFKGDDLYRTKIDENDSSWGYVALAGFQFWATDRIVVGGEYSYKHHEFDFHGSSDVEAGGDFRHTNDNIGVDDDVHAFKIKASLKLN